MKALVQKDGRTAEVVADDDIFPVHPDLEWVDCPAGTETEDVFDKRDASFSRPTAPLEPTVTEMLANRLEFDAVWRGTIQRQAKAEGKTVAGVIAEIEAEIEG